MDELIDILDANGKPTGNTELKSKAHRLGLFHATAHIWLYTKTGELLLQQRSVNKDIFPLLWDVSVAGHIGAGEKIEVSAVREIEEEIGLKVQEQDLEKIGVYKSMQTHSDTLQDNEFHHTFLCALKVPFGFLKKQESEVADLKLISLIHFEQELASNFLSKQYVPHAQGYYEKITDAIMSRL